MPVSATLGEMWVTSGDRRTVRFNLPPVPVTGLAEPLHVHLDCDGKAVDEILQRLTVQPDGSATGAKLVTSKY
jgi:hypothetical protein